MDEKTASLEQVRAFTINLDALPSFSHVTCKKEKNRPSTYQELLKLYTRFLY